MHSDNGGGFSSGLLAEFCRDEGIIQTFTPLRRKMGLLSLNLWPRVSLSETSPTLRWTGKVGDASAFQVWGALSLVCNTTASKLSPRTLLCAFLGFPTDAPPWQFYHPRSCRNPSPPQGLAPLGVSQVDPPFLVEPLEISSDSSGPAEGGDPAADDTAATRRSPRLETPPGFPPRPSSPPLQPIAVDTGSRGAASGGDDSGGASNPSGVGAMGASTAGHGVGQQHLPTAGRGGAGGAGAGGARGVGAAGAGGIGGTGGAGTAGTGGVGARGTGAAGSGGAGGAGGTAGAGGTRARGAGGAAARGASAGGAEAADGAGTAPRRPFFLPAAAVIPAAAGLGPLPGS
ncbi:unnamed protein product [Closterium sp. NIES-53]